MPLESYRSRKSPIDSFDQAKIWAAEQVNWLSPRTRPPSLREVHPLGKSPVITDGALTIAESRAIIEYLVEKWPAPGLAPGLDEPERVRYLYWMHFAEGSAMPPLLLKLMFDRIERAPMSFFARPIARSIARRAKGELVEPQIVQQLDFVEAELGLS